MTSGLCGWMVAPSSLPTIAALLTFDRGPMVFVTLFACVVSIVGVEALRPRSDRSFWLSLVLCFLPLISGLAVWGLGLRMAHAHWEQFMMATPSSVEAARLSLEIGGMVAREHFFFGAALCLPPLLLTFMKSQRR